MITSTRPKPRLWTREEYHLAAKLGVFRPGERLELLEGEIIQKVSPQSKAHAWGVSRSAEILRGAFGAGYHVREEKPLVLTDASEPEPDIVVVRGALLETPGHPTPANAVLVLEVSSSTLDFDQGEKAASYARSGILDYWILNLRSRRLEVRRDPGLIGENEYGYRTLQIVRDDGEISPLAAPNVSIRVADLLPAPLSEAETDDE